MNAEYKRVKKNPVAMARGKASAEKRGHAEMKECASEGGRIRAIRLTPRQRSEIAQKASTARWNKVREAAEEAAEIDRRAREIAVEIYGDPYADLIS